MSTSHTCLSGCTRRDPKQRRGEKRVEDLLRAAVAEFAAAGYEGATMSGIARRAGASIGSLYQFFPDKESVARVVRTRHVEDVERKWETLEPIAGGTFVDRFVDLMLTFVDEHPAFLALQDAPASTQPFEPRKRLRAKLSEILLKSTTQLTRAEAMRITEVVLTTNRAFLGLYARATSAERPWVAREYREVLRGVFSRGLGEAVGEGETVGAGGNGRRNGRAPGRARRAPAVRGK
jgi:AcrR family transcriptional regulator